MPMTKYTPAAEVNKIVRRVLKAALPGTKFSVTKSNETTIRIGWTDGPTARQVDDLTQFARGGDFDGMTDTMNYRPATGALYSENSIVAEELAKYTGDWGATFHPLNDFVFTSRSVSIEALEVAAADLEVEMGVAVDRHEDGTLNLHDYSPVAQEVSERTNLYARNWDQVLSTRLADVDLTASAVAAK